MESGASNLIISKNANIHSTAILETGNIKIEDEVEIGPYCVLRGNITLNKGVRLISHVSLSGNTEIGDGTTLYPFSSIGQIPQDLKYRGEESYLIIGKDNIIRENVTINSGTFHGGMYTRIGDSNLFMIGSHVGHDCQIGSNCIIANGVGIAGHVILEDNVIIGGQSGVHQFVRIGRNAMIGGMSGVSKDVPPFTLYNGVRGTEALRGLNLIGLKRHGFSIETIRLIKDAYDFIFSGKEAIVEAAKKLEQTNKDEKVKFLLQFILAERGRYIYKWDLNYPNTEDV